MMKLGFLTAILQDYSFEQTIDFAAEQGFKCVEAACWPRGAAQRRYAGVTHIDVERLTEEEIGRIKAYCRRRQVEISALAYYPNTLDEDPDRRRYAVSHLLKLIEAAQKLDVNLVTTFIGRLKQRTVEENLEEMCRVWRPILKAAEEHNVRIAIENCPMLFGQEQWPGGDNLFTTPAIWRQVFELLPSACLGINFDPSHCVWQMLDYIKPVYEFRDKIFHVHIKDIKLYPEKLSRVGTMAYPLDYMSPKLPGLGDVDWGKYISALTDIGYDGYVCLEIEDRAFEGSDQSIQESLIRSKRYMEQYVI